MQTTSNRILCFSPTESSMAVARKISSCFDAEIIDITKAENRAGFENSILEYTNVLFVICPVYSQGVPKIVKKFLSSLNFFGFVVPCVVFGSISAGHALFDLTKLIKKRNGKILGGLEISTPHIYLSLINKCENINNKNQLTNYFNVLKKRIDDDKIFDQKIKKRINLLAFIFPNLRARIGVGSPKVNFDYCIKCNNCIKVCPVNAINKNLCINNKKCIRCLACVKFCPKNARKLKFSKSMLWYLNRYSLDSEIFTGY